VQNSERRCARGPAADDVREVEGQDQEVPDSRRKKGPDPQPKARTGWVRTSKVFLRTNSERQDRPNGVGLDANKANV